MGWFSGFARSLLGASSAITWSAPMGWPSVVFTPESPPRTATT